MLRIFILDIGANNADENMTNMKTKRKGFPCRNSEENNKHYSTLFSPTKRVESNRLILQYCMKTSKWETIIRRDK